MGYLAVNWQPGEEAVTSKLNQMAQNEQYLKDNLVLGNFKWVSNDGVVPFQRTNPAQQKATRIDGVYVPFDSVTPAVFHIVEVPYPSGYTNPPIATFSIAQGQGYPLQAIWIQDGPAAGPGKVLVYSPAGTGDTGGIRIRGALNVLLFGS